MATILITGAARRIGKAMALDLGAGGHTIIIHHHNSADEADAVVSEIRVAETLLLSESSIVTKISKIVLAKM